jgi:signal transduction histidine kinase
MSQARLLKLVDLAVVLFLAVTAVWQLRQMPDSTLQGGFGVHAVLVVAFTLPLLLRERHPVAVFVTVAAASWLQLQLGGGLGQPFFAFVVALYSVGAHAASSRALVGPAAVLAQVIFVDLPRLRDGDRVDEVIPTWFVLFGVWAFGRWMRHRRAEAVELTERAEAAERDREANEARAVAQERTRIARELHDLVAHSMGVIVLQAQGAQRVLDLDHQQARAAMAAIESTGRSGLDEMRRLLGLLTEAPGQHSASGLGSQPKLAEIGDLVSRVREAGLPVDLEVDGHVRTLSPGIELTGFRVVQEALTNAYKHAGAVPTLVRLHYAPGSLEIDITNAGGRGEAQPTLGGHGLLGMRERVRLYGGCLEAQPRSEGGFTVHATIPVGGVPT